LGRKALAAEVDVSDENQVIQFNPAYKEAAYRVSKTGVQVFAETAAIELAPYGIRVNTVSPGLINSPHWTKGVLPKTANDLNIGEGFMSNIPLGRLGLPNDVGSAYAFLASNKVSYSRVLLQWTYMVDSFTSGL